MYRAIALALVVALGATTGFAAERPFSPPPGVVAIADPFFAQLKSGNFAEAYHSAFADTEYAIGGGATIDNLAAQTDTLFKSLGEITEWSLYKANVITPYFLELTYVVKCSHVPVFVTIQFYNPGPSWRIIDVRLNTLIQARTAGYVTDVSPEPSP